MKQALILVDIQNDYFAGGKMPLVGMDKASQNAGLLLHKFRREQLPLVHIQHISNRPGATFFLADSEGAGIHESVAPQPAETVVQKHFPNSFRETNLLQILKNAEVGEVVICGAMSHMCIDATTRAAFDYGLSCIVVADACATRNLEYEGVLVEAEKVHAAFMAALAVPYAKVVTASDFIRE
ncbi:MAG: cysteine hydrolase family protein [Desulfoferrobacter sp.]